MTVGDQALAVPPAWLLCRHAFFQMSAAGISVRLMHALVVQRHYLLSADNVLKEADVALAPAVARNSTGMRGSLLLVSDADLADVFVWEEQGGEPSFSL